MLLERKTFCHFCGARLDEKFLEGRCRLYCGKCHKIIYENPVPATCLVVPDKREKILLVKRNMDPRKGFWCLPGGFIELGETPEQAALRELKEETGLDGRIPSLIGIHSNYSPEYNTVLLVGYLVQQYSGILKAGDDASEVDFFPMDRLPEVAFESHLNFIRMYHCGRTY